MKELTSYVKKNDSDVVELDILKKILITLSKEIPNSEYEDDKKYLDEFNDIKSDIDVLKLLNKRLSDLVPRTRTVKCIMKDGIEYRDTVYKEDIINLHLSSYGNWEYEYDTTGEMGQIKKAFVDGYLQVNLKSSDVMKKNIELGYTYVEYISNCILLNGVIPCMVFKSGVVALGFIYFSNDVIELICDDFSFLTDTNQEVQLFFNGMVSYEEY